MTNTVVCFVVRRGHLLLGRQLVGAARGQYAGFTGAYQPTSEPGHPLETEQALVARILMSQAGIKARHPSMVGALTIYRSNQPEATLTVEYVDEFKGQPHQTETVQPEWFAVGHIPYRALPNHYVRWLPNVIGRQHFRGELTFGPDGELLRGEIQRLPHGKIEKW